jgi:imidazole glycerol-phosphate synthase subunit HisH
VVATCDYGGPVTAMVERGRLWATQFHPEKSGRTGLAVLRRFAEVCARSRSGAPERAPQV